MTPESIRRRSASRNAPEGTRSSSTSRMRSAPRSARLRVARPRMTIGIWASIFPGSFSDDYQDYASGRDGGGVHHRGGMWGRREQHFGRQHAEDAATYSDA